MLEAYFFNSHSDRVQIKRKFFVSDCQKINPIIYDPRGIFVFLCFIENKNSIFFCWFAHLIFFFSFILQLLDISRNQLNGIEDSQAIMLQKIKDVRLEGNPLICDRCHMGSLIQMVKHVSRFTDFISNCPYASTQAQAHHIFFCVRLIGICIFFWYLFMQLRWSLHPVCFLPESLRGIQISDLNIGSLDVCTAAESLHDETFDAASTSHNFLTRGN